MQRHVYLVQLQSLCSFLATDLFIIEGELRALELSQLQCHPAPCDRKVNTHSSWHCQLLSHSISFRGTCQVSLLALSEVQTKMNSGDATTVIHMKVALPTPSVWLFSVVTARAQRYTDLLTPNVFQFVRFDSWVSGFRWLNPVITHVVEVQSALQTQTLPLTKWFSFMLYSHTKLQLIKCDMCGLAFKSLHINLLVSTPLSYENIWELYLIYYTWWYYLTYSVVLRTMTILNFY